jgi:hypothetical protein
MGFEPTTSSLGSWHSTPELRPPIAQKCQFPRSPSTRFATVGHDGPAPLRAGLALPAGTRGQVCLYRHARIPAPLACNWNG